MSEILDLLWGEKYRPQTLDELVIAPEVRKQIDDFVKKESIPHLLLVGSAGLGKSSLAKILVNDVLDCEYLNINAADEGGVDVIRTKVKSFASSATFDDKLKVVIFGEADGMSPQAQNSLKEIIEDYSETTRFIFTSNHLSKIVEPIVSRCQRIDLHCSYEDFKAHCAVILDKEKVAYEDKELEKITKPAFPDFRTAVVALRASSIEGTLKVSKQKQNKFVTLIWGLISRYEPEKIREFYLNQAAQYGTFSDLMVDMMRYALDNFEPSSSRPVLMLMNKYLVQDKEHADPELNFYCLVLELSELQKG
jgi:replication factor C small subunit